MANLMSELKPLVEIYVDQFFAKWKRQMKMAMLIGSTLLYLNEQGLRLTEGEVADIIYDIIAERNFAIFGDIKKWRHSEIVPREYL